MNLPMPTPIRQQMSRMECRHTSYGLESFHFHDTLEVGMPGLRYGYTSTVHRRNIEPFRYIDHDIRRSFCLSSHPNFLLSSS